MMVNGVMFVFNDGKGGPRLRRAEYLYDYREHFRWRGGKTVEKRKYETARVTRGQRNGINDNRYGIVR
jgi:hypothetical protein